MSPSPTDLSPQPQAKQPSSKKPNPLVDLIDTEKTYVELLTGIIRVRSLHPANNSDNLHLLTNGFIRK